MYTHICYLQVSQTCPPNTQCSIYQTQSQYPRIYFKKVKIILLKSGNSFVWKVWLYIKMVNKHNKHLEKENNNNNIKFLIDPQWETRDLPNTVTRRDHFKAIIWSNLGFILTITSLYDLDDLTISNSPDHSYKKKKKLPVVKGSNTAEIVPPVI